VQVLPLQIDDLAAAGLALRVAQQTPLPRLQEVLAPVVVQVRADALAPAQLGDRLLAAQTFQDDPDLLFGGELAAGLGV